MPTSLPYPNPYPGNGNWWSTWLDGSRHSQQELGAFRGYQTEQNQDPDRMDSAALDASYAAFRAKITADGATGILTPPLPPDLR